VPDEIFCAGGCKKSLPDTKAAEDAGWSFLHITGRYRCGECERRLRWASTVEGSAPRNEPDKLPPDSIGALKALPKREPLKEKVR
jgi:hypothetical protein